jgi:5-methylcytosine-specific restriction endonuclease McrA
MTERPTQDLRNAVYKRAGGQCECSMLICGHHSGRCLEKLSGEWELHRLVAAEAYALANVIGMCQRCHRNMPSYGVERH